MAFVLTGYFAKDPGQNLRRTNPRKNPDKIQEMTIKSETAKILEMTTKTRK